MTDTSGAPMTLADHYPAGAQVLFQGSEIHAKVAEMATGIREVYGDEEITIVAVLHGALIFVADLMRALPMPMHLTAVVASSYRGAATSPGELEISLNSELDIADRHVLLVDDILDTGRTLHRLKQVVATQKPRSVRVAALVDKPSRRVAELQADFVGFEIPDLFIVGYGLDYNGHYRNLPDIVALPAGS